MLDSPGHFGAFGSSLMSASTQSTSSDSSGSPPTLNLLGNSEITRPSWLFNTQSIYGAQSTPTEALSSLLDPFSSPVNEVSSSPLHNISQLTGAPYMQMATNRYTQSARRALGSLASPAMCEPSNPLGAPGTPLNGGSMNYTSQVSTTNSSNVPPPKNPKLYKTELCRSWMDHGRCNYGERCQYAHGEVEKRAIPRHPKYKTEACQSFHQSGYCPYGPRCHFIHNESELLSQISPPQSTINGFSTSPTSMTSHSTTSTIGGPGGPAMTLGAPISAMSNNLMRMTSLPAGYGSSGESPPGSSADSGSGSDSPHGSFSPGLELEQDGPFTAGFMALPVIKRQTQSVSSSRYAAGLYEPKRDAPTTSVSGLIGDLMNWNLNFEETSKWEETPGRLPVFAQLSNAQ